MDKDIDRYRAIVASSQPIKSMIHRWPATYGKQETVRNALADGISTLISSKKYEKDYEPDGLVQRNPGAVGCWLSHKRLLRHLSTLDVSSSTAHLVVEDDIMLTPDFLNEWETRRHSIPADWDIVFLDINALKGIPIADGLQKAIVTNDTGNWGTQAYIVRHGSLQSRILPEIRYMESEIDVQLNNHADFLNIYIFQPSLLRLNTKFSETSTIEKRKPV
jgi:GR25 family glycosyltransferase involved in LPS biosynthesis